MEEEVVVVVVVSSEACHAPPEVIWAVAPCIGCSAPGVAGQVVSQSLTSLSCPESPNTLTPTLGRTEHSQGGSLSVPFVVRQKRAQLCY